MNNLKSVNLKPKSKFSTHFDCQFAVELKRKISPFILEKCIKDHIGAKPRTKDASTFFIEISTHSESVSMTALDKIYKFPVQTRVNNTSDIQKGLILRIVKD